MADLAELRELSLRLNLGEPAPPTVRPSSPEMDLPSAVDLVMAATPGSAPPPAAESPSTPAFYTPTAPTPTSNKSASILSRATSADIFPTNTNPAAVQKAMSAMHDKVKEVKAERDTLATDHAVLKSQHAEVSAAHATLSGTFDEQVEGIRVAAAREVKDSLAQSTSQKLAMHKELDFVKDLAQAAESEKRAAQAAQVQMERQMAGMRFDAETRMHELEQRAISAGQSEAVALARCKEIEQSYEQLRRQYDELASQKKRVDEALRSVMGINESLLGRISSCGDAPRLPMPKGAGGGGGGGAGGAMGGGRGGGGFSAPPQPPPPPPDPLPHAPTSMLADRHRHKTSCELRGKQAPLSCETAAAAADSAALVAAANAAAESIQGPPGPPEYDDKVVYSDQPVGTRPQTEYAPYLDLPVPTSEGATAGSSSSDANKPSSPTPPWQSYMYHNTAGGAGGPSDTLLPSGDPYGPGPLPPPPPPEVGALRSLPPGTGDPYAQYVADRARIASHHNAAVPSTAYDAPPQPPPPPPQHPHPADAAAAAAAAGIAYVEGAGGAVDPKEAEWHAKYASLDQVVAEGRDAFAKYSAAHGERTVHRVPPMPTMEATVEAHSGADGVGSYARPTEAWDRRMLESLEPPPYSARRRGMPGPPSCLTREPYSAPKVQYVSVADARIQWDDGNREEQQQQQQPPPQPPSLTTRHATTTAAAAQRAAGGGRGGGSKRASSNVPSNKRAFCAMSSAQSSSRTHRHITPSTSAPKPMPHLKGRPVPRKVAEVLLRDSSGLIDYEGYGAGLEVRNVIKSLEYELQDLNTQYSRTVAELRKPMSTGEEEGVHARMRTVVLQMEQKSAQLSALRRTHTQLTNQVGAVRDELAITRGALEEAAETAAQRFVRVRRLEKELLEQGPQ